MIELYLSKVTETSESEQAGKLYARVSYKQTLGVQEMAHHMAEHNTMFSEGSITGILIDFVKCVREMVLMGNTVKIDNLAIFKATVEANGLETMYDASTDKVALATIGNLAEGAKTGPAVKVIKLLAQSTGEFTRDELKKDAKLSWTDKTKAEIAAAKTAATGSAESNGSSQNQGGNSQATSFALTITKSGSGTSTVKNDSEETINSGDTLASGANVYISVTPAEGQIPTATLNGTNVSLTENDGEYIGTFQMPAQASSLVINSGSDSEEGDQN